MEKYGYTLWLIYLADQNPFPTFLSLASIVIQQNSFLSQPSLIESSSFRLFIYLHRALHDLADLGNFCGWP